MSLVEPSECSNLKLLENKNTMLNSNLFSTYGYKEYEKLLNEIKDSDQKEKFEAILEKDFKDSYREEHQFLNIGDVDRAYRLATKIEMQ